MSVHIRFDDLTIKEKEALKQLEKAFKTLAKRHWFYATGSDFNIIRISADDQMLLSNGVNPEYVAAQISGYCTDGGDW